VNRAAEELVWGLPHDAADTTLGRELLDLLADAPQAAPGKPCEVEIVLRPGSGRFSRRAECRLLVLEGDAEASLRRQADQIHDVRAARPDRPLARILAECG
jgi:hypothetical protein